ncbi:fungal-specific transcription factor domain-containing protein [Microdochium trichocladiopsis]|uniref:Fungal-specific transcription factor domain-containing protein n=1 Tax=Microdochium trichocladiopsis TaxID=1682393 RepID=A0A9P8XX31_9PEZI|nr:fungal-specific transcription factor domain-containing protein [Microdochium trichocladiopsis]KAH7024423.1 fungal-specific transcription factor domain-containing protein [Microdochium trichocladiopsis]
MMMMGNSQQTGQEQGDMPSQGLSNQGPAATDPFATFDPILLDIADQQQQPRPQTSLAEELKALSLQATAERHLGSSSGISFARLTQTVLRRLTPDKADFVFENVLEDMSPSTLLAAAFPMAGPGSPSTTFPQPLFGNISLADITDTGISLASLPLPDEAHIRHLVDFYFAHTHTLYPFLARGEFGNVLARALASPNDPVAQSPLSLFKIWMVLAIGSTTYSAVTLAEESESVLFYSKALEYLEAALGYGDLAALEVIMLQVCYSFFNQLGPNTWFLVGLAARLAMGIGLHSASTYEDLPFIAVQQRKRLFFSIYMMDRLVSTALGRPFAIHDDDIEVEPFADVDDDEEDASSVNRPRDPLKPSIMAIPLHILRLRQIASKTARLVYSNRISHPQSSDMSSPRLPQHPHHSHHHQNLHQQQLHQHQHQTHHDREAILQSLHKELLDWRRAMPFPLPDTHAQVPHLSSTWFDLNYYTHLAILYRPSPLLPVPSAERVATLAEAASMAIRQAASMHRQRRFAYNWLNLLSVYTSVLSLVYATTARPESLPVVLAKSSAIEDLGLAVELLGTLAAKFPAAGKIKRMVEEIVARYESLRSSGGGGVGGGENVGGGGANGAQAQQPAPSSSGQVA